MKITKQFILADIVLYGRKEYVMSEKLKLE